jgi:hypothetical protein
MNRSKRRNLERLVAAAKRAQRFHQPRKESDMAFDYSIIKIKRIHKKDYPLKVANWRSNDGYHGMDEWWELTDKPEVHLIYRDEENAEWCIWVPYIYGIGRSGGKYYINVENDGGTLSKGRFLPDNVFAKLTKADDAPPVAESPPAFVNGESGSIASWPRSAPAPAPAPVTADLFASVDLEPRATLKIGDEFRIRNEADRKEFANSFNNEYRWHMGQTPIPGQISSNSQWSTIMDLGFKVVLEYEGIQNVEKTAKKPRAKKNAPTA